MNKTEFSETKSRIVKKKSCITPDVGSFNVFFINFFPKVRHLMILYRVISADLEVKFFRIFKFEIVL